MLDIIYALIIVSSVLTLIPLWYAYQDLVRWTRCVQRKVASNPSDVTRVSRISKDVLRITFSSGYECQIDALMWPDRYLRKLRAVCPTATFEVGT